MANRLIGQQSPYLLQHAHNPVDWYPWCDEAFKRAETENKPVLISIGYAACHWCHVMEHESFENEEVAAFMNQHFINIKVDREEHPDVDYMYMDAVQAISGSGGWPLNVFATPGRVPFYGGTYYPPRPAYNRPSWVQLLQRMHQIWTEQQDEVNAQANQMLQHLQNAAKAGVATQGVVWDKATCAGMVKNLLDQADKEFGGFGRAPKFPGTMAITYLLEYHHYSKEEAPLQHALHSLDAMINGGIYDQLGGGFARYSTDEKWLAPHFEKMLYDNALLVMSMADAYTLTGKPNYRKAIEETIAFAERELKEPSGGYYSALDADSEGVEGKFYTWTWEEWVEATGGDALLEAYWGILPEGNWEHTNILHVAREIAQLAQETGISEPEIAQRISDATHRLLKLRAFRQRPLTDDKSLLSWNALMNIALVKAGIALGETTYIDRAKAHATWMLKAFYDGEWKHVWKQGNARISANLDDLAYLSQALLQLASATGDESFILKAAELVSSVIESFTDEAGVFFYYTSSQQTDIPVRKVELYDGALPSSSAVMAHNMLLLGLVMERQDWLERAYGMLRQMAGSASRYTYSFAYWAMLMQRYDKGLLTAVSTGPEAEIWHQQVQKHYLPHVYVITSQKEISEVSVLQHKHSSQQTNIFVCTQESCLPPETDVARALHLMNS
jgi:uncharacterized protein